MLSNEIIGFIICVALVMSVIFFALKISTSNPATPQVATSHTSAPQPVITNLKL